MTEENMMELPAVYLAGKVRGTKWDVVKGIEEAACFIASDGDTHGEHKWGYWEYRYGELKRDVAQNCIEKINACDLLLAFLDSPDSYGSIAEISYASALGKPCYLIILDPDYEKADLEHMPAFFDSYWLISNFPGVTTSTVSSVEEATFVTLKIVEEAAVEMLLADFKKTFESPLEEKFALALINQARFITLGSGGGPVLQCQLGGKLVQIHTQFPVRIAKSYRLDFLIECGDLSLAVEIDGHDFHERTKEQAQRDKERDRHLTAADYTVLRFTGSEVYRDVNKVVKEVVSFVEAQPD